MDQPNISGAVPTDATEPEVQELPPELRADLETATAQMDEPDEPVWEPDPIPSEVVTLDDGESWVLLRQPDEFSARDIKPAMRGMAIGGITSFVDGLAPRAVKQWNLKDRSGKPVKPPSINADAMDQITPMHWNELARYIAVYYQHFDPPTNRKRPTTA